MVLWYLIMQHKPIFHINITLKESWSLEEIFYPLKQFDLFETIFNCIKFKFKWNSIWPEVDKSEPIKPTPNPPQSGIISSGNVLGIIATVGGALFVCNLCLLYCYVKRRAGKHIFGEFFNHIKISCFQARPLPTLDILWSIVYWKRSQKFPSL